LGHPASPAQNIYALKVATNREHKGDFIDCALFAKEERLDSQMNLFPLSWGDRRRILRENNPAEEPVPQEYDNAANAPVAQLSHHRPRQNRDRDAGAQVLTQRQTAGFPVVAGKAAFAPISLSDILCLDRRELTWRQPSNR
jgi:hypothetical protein